MADINRLHRTLWVPFALMALAACAPANDPAKTVERDAGTESTPARPVGDAMQMRPAQPAEAEVLPDAVDVQRNADGSVDVRKAMPESVALRRTDDGGRGDPQGGGARRTCRHGAGPRCTAAVSRSRPGGWCARRGGSDAGAARIAADSVLCRPSASSPRLRQ
ncbi:hypothetical protein [Stenotrophomonas sp. TWI1409]|uniref:hypothetical protein n=1 Tax=unclassified Stenotrophomonas TaxID=196198 RepID=UPI0032089D8F